MDRKLETAESHGENGLGDIEVPEVYNKSEGDAVKALIENADPNTKLLTLGPLTNIAKAVRKEPDLLEKYKSVTVMGGAVETFGNVNRISEFNFWVDPEAASTVIQNSPKNISLVPVNACREVLMSIEKIERLFDRSEYQDIFRPYIQYYRENSVFDGAVMYDALAAAVSVNSNLVEFKEINAVVETRGEKTRGMLIPEKRPQKNIEANLKYVSNVNKGAKAEICSRI